MNLTKKTGIYVKKILISRQEPSADHAPITLRSSSVGQLVEKSS